MGMRQTGPPYLALVALLALVACASTPTPTATQIPTQTSTPAPTHTIPPAPTHTRPPTATATPTPHLARAPTKTPASFSPTPTPTLPSGALLDVEPSPPSTDALLLIRQDGAMVLHDLQESRERVLLDPGTYDLSGKHVDALVFLRPLMRLSPDGRWFLVPTPDRGTWLVSLDGAPSRQISEDGLIATWAPDSRRIVFTRFGGQVESERDKEVYVQDVVEGREPRLLARLPDRAVHSAWSPGCDDEDARRDCGRSVAVTSCQRAAPYACTAWLVDVASAEVRKLGQFANPRMGIGPSDFTWSAEGNEFRASSYHGRVAFPVDGGNPRPVVDIGRCEPSTDVELPCPDGTRSPDGALCARWEPIPGRDTSSRLVVEDASGERFHLDFPTSRAEWTGDGRRILVEAYTSEAEASLWTVDPANGERRLIAEHLQRYLYSLQTMPRRSTEVDPPGPLLRTLPAPGDPSAWVVHELSDWRVSVHVPPEWRLETQEAARTGEVWRVTIASFDGECGPASLGDEHVEISLTYTPLRDMPPDPVFWLAGIERQSPDRFVVERTEVGGRPAARVRDAVSPVSQEIRVALRYGELRIAYRPLSSDLVPVLDQMLDLLEFRDRSPWVLDPPTGPLAFIDPEKHLHIRDDDGEVCAITSDGIAGSPAWHSGGTRLAFSYQADDRSPAELRIHDLQTGDQTTAWTNPDPGTSRAWPIREIAWSPSGRYLAFSQGCCPLGLVSVWDLEAAALAGRYGALQMFWGPEEDVLTLSIPQPVGEFIPIGSGDSTSIALVRPYAISPTVVLTGTTETLYSARAWLSRDELAYMQYDLTNEGKETERTWWTARIVDGEAIDSRELDLPPLAHDNDAFRERLSPWLSGATFGDQVWSADGTWVVFRARRDREAPRRIYAFQWEEGQLVGPLAEGTDLALAPVRTAWRCPE